MNDLDVHVERLGPMRVASVRAISRSPEEDAWSILRAWAQPVGLFDDPVAHPVFGFNNPSPSPGADEYGYEFWIAVGPGTHSPGGIVLKDFEGGLYAVTTCAVGPDMPQRWEALVRWVESSPHTWRRSTHELERLHNPLAPPQEMVVDLCLPIVNAECQMPNDR